MTRQPDLFSPMLARVTCRQPRLFDPNDVRAGDSDLSCQVCGAFLVRTDSFLCCPNGHGRLICEAEDAERCGSWFEPDDV